MQVLSTDNIELGHLNSLNASKILFCFNGLLNEIHRCSDVFEVLERLNILAKHNSTFDRNFHWIGNSDELWIHQILNDDKLILRIKN